MTLIVEATKQSHKRDVLIKMNHIRDITDQLVLDSGSDWYIEDYNLDPYIIVQSGFFLTFGFTGTTLDVTTVYTPSDTNPVYAYHNAFLTNGTSKYLDKFDPTGAISDVVEWEPLLLTTPTVSQSSNDIIEGQVSISSSGFSVSLLTDFAKYFGVDDSFYHANISYWYGFNDEYELFYEGIIEDHSLTSTKANFTVKSPLKKLKQTAYLSDDISNCVLRKSDYSGIRNSDDGRPIPFYYATSHYRSISKREVSVANYYEFPDANNCPQVLGTSWTGEYDIPDDGIIGRFPHAINDETITTTSITATTDAYGVTVTKFNASLANLKKLVVGCKVLIAYSGSSVHDTVIEINYSGGYFIAQNSTSASLPISSVVRPGLQIFSTRTDSPEYRPDYYVVGSLGYAQASTLLSTGHYLWSYTSLGSNVSRKGQPHFFIAFVDTPTTHADAMDEIVSSVGLTKNSTSFTNADSDFVADAYFSIPKFGENSYPSALEMVQNIAASTLSLLYFDNSSELNYDIVGSISGATADYEITEVDIIDNSIRKNTAYQDISSSYDIYNGMLLDGRWEAFGSSISGESLRSKVLYDIDKTFSKEHYLSTIPSTNETDIKNYITQKRLWYDFSLSPKFIKIQVGDVVEITTADINQGDPTKMLVIGYQKSIDKVMVTCLELTI
jgi:hypothetical protein